jgi:hypothetical protein
MSKHREAFSILAGLMSYENIRARSPRLFEGSRIWYPWSARSRHERKCEDAIITW